MPRSTLRSLHLCALLLAVACGGDGKTSDTVATGSTTDGTTTDETSTGVTSTTASTATSGPMTASDSDTQPTSTGPDTTSTTTAPGTTTEADTTGEPDACDDLNEMMCAKNQACMALTGAKINVEMMCTNKAMFLGCVPLTGCDDAITIACQNGSKEPWQFPSGCLPPDFMACDGQPVDGPCK